MFYVIYIVCVMQMVRFRVKSILVSGIITNKVTQTYFAICLKYATNCFIPKLLEGISYFCDVTNTLVH